MTKKSKHKHEYQDCLFIFEESCRAVWRGSYCLICGKIYDMKRETVKVNGKYMELTDEEVLEKYKQLPKFKVSGLFAKYVPIVSA